LSGADEKVGIFTGVVDLLSSSVIVGKDDTIFGEEGDQTGVGGIKNNKLRVEGF
jgi:hypothetical protein